MQFAKIVQPRKIQQFSQIIRTGLFSLFFVLAALFLSGRANTPTATAMIPVAPGDVPEGLTAGEWGSFQEMVQAAEYQFAYHDATEAIPTPYFWATNQAQNWDLVFTATGPQVTPKDPDAQWRWGTHLTRYGYADQWQTLDNPPVLAADKDLINYQWDDNLHEWWVNRPEGLEQGFTLQSRPPGADGTLIVEMRLSGTLTPVQRGGALFFKDSDETTVLAYDKLYVTDARGKAIPATFALQRGQLQIVVQDAEADYPLTIDPLATSHTVALTASDGAEQDIFGQSVAISGDTAVVGSPWDDEYSGSVYIFARNQSGTDLWGEVVKLTASDAAAGDLFGDSVAISGDTVVIGAPDDDDDGSDSGSAYIFVRNTGGADNWGQVAKLTASDAAADDNFGDSVAISSDTVVVGARRNDDDGSDSGSAYIFVRNTGGLIIGGRW